jgi:cell division protein FtsL
VSTAFLAFLPEPANYIWAFIITQLFFIPTGFLFLYSLKHVEKDIRDVKRIMSERADEIKQGEQDIADLSKPTTIPDEL